MVITLRVIEVPSSGTVRPSEYLPACWWEPVSGGSVLRLPIPGYYGRRLTMASAKAFCGPMWLGQLASATAKTTPNMTTSSITTMRSDIMTPSGLVLSWPPKTYEEHPESWFDSADRVAWPFGPWARWRYPHMMICLWRVWGLVVLTLYGPMLVRGGCEISRQ